MRGALLRGHVGVDGLLAVATPLREIERRVGREVVLLAEAELAAAARGEGADAAPPACADLLRVQATVWATVLDPDGSEPREGEALHGRGFTLGTPRRGVVPFHGNLLPEVAAQLQRIIDAVDAPRGRDDTGGVRFRRRANRMANRIATRRRPDTDAGERIPLDDRRPAQRRHDALATALFAAAASGTLPTIGGAAPVLVVSAREADVLDGQGLGARRRLRGAAADRCRAPRRVRRDRPEDPAQRPRPDRPDRHRGAASSTGISAGGSRSATAAASSPAAMSPPAGVKSITSSNTTTAGRRTPTTACCSAGTTTASSTGTAGRSG